MRTPWRHAAASFVAVAAIGLLSPGPAKAGLISYSVFDAPAAPGHSYVLGLLPDPSLGPTGVALVTIAEVYQFQTPSFVKIYDITGLISGIDIGSAAAIAPSSGTPPNSLKVVYTGFADFGYAFQTLTYLPGELPASSLVNFPIPAPLTFPQYGAQNLDLIATGLTSDALQQVYVFLTGGIAQYQSYQDPVLIKTIGATGPGALTQASAAIAVGNGILYALDQPNSRINSYDTATGDFLGSFPVVSVDGVNAMTLSPSGQLYLTNGDGGVNVYDPATGQLLETYEALTGTPDPQGVYVNGGYGLEAYGGGGDALYLDPAGDLYLYDSATSFHIFETAPRPATPDPATASLAAAGLIALLLLRRLRPAAH